MPKRTSPDLVDICFAPGLPPRGVKGFTREDQLADQGKCKYLGTLGEMTDVTPCGGLRQKS